MSDAWVEAGLAGLSGRADGLPCRPPAELEAAVHRLVAEAPVGDPLALLGERAALGRLARRGSTSCGGSARLLECADGWLALALPRPDDLDLLPAWLHPLRSGTSALFSTTEGWTQNDEVWEAIAGVVGERSLGELVSWGAELGLAVAEVGERGPGPAVVRTELGGAPPLEDPPLVVDLSSLWAGPLCSHLLQIQGARVVKVESTRRPDGLRRDPSGFFDLLNHGKASVALDLAVPGGRRDLARLVAVADVVIEGSRPRALRQLGIDTEAAARVWVSITGHGRAAERVGFGDDTAAAGGLVLWDGGAPIFLADAVADPLTGIAAATAATECLAAGGRWLLDASLAGVAASVARPHSKAEPVTGPAPAPRARPLPGPAPSLGADTTRVLASLP